MGRPTPSSQVLILLLAALLAWPWNVVFLAAESSQIEAVLRARLGAVRMPEAVCVHRVVRPVWWDQQSCSIASPDYDRSEEEGDDGGPLSSTTGLVAPPIPSARDFPAYSTTIPAILPPMVTREHPCHRRC